MKRLVLTISFIVCFGLCESQTYFLNGSAQSIGDDCYQLTQTSTNQNGTVWYGNQINLTEPFDLQFTMNFGTLDANGADGICFVLQTVGTAAIGQSGGGMGYLNFGTSLGIEFDTWQNAEYGDPTYDHIAIEKNGDINHNGIGNIAGPVQADPLDVNIEDGENHVARIVWNPSDHILHVYFDCVFRLSGEVDLINEIFNGQELVYWGFTAATGGSWNDQTVCLQENILNVGQHISLCNGGSVLLQAGSSIDGVYNWTPSSFLDDPLSASPMASPPSNATYQVSFTDLCNQPVELTFNLDVSPLVVNVSPLQQITCTHPNSTINALINFNTEANYTWSLDGNTIIAADGLSSFTTNQPGDYLVAVNAMNGCIASNAFTILSNFSVVNVSAGEDLQIDCNNASVYINATSSGNNGAISWTQNGNAITGANALQLHAAEPGIYSISIEHIVSGCLESDSVVVTSDFSAPSITTGDQDSLTCVFPIVAIRNVNVVSTHDYSVQWTTIEGTITGGAASLTPTVSEESQYQITATDNETGCTSIEVIFIGESADFQVDLSSLVFPNIITPNGDSKNDLWHPFLQNNSHADLSNVFSDYHLKIFNRWGTMIFETKKFNSSWNGGEESNGVYYYLLQFKTNCDNGKTGNVEGHVQLLR